MAVAEMVGDKMETAPDRTVLLGLAARTITSGFAGATLAPPQRQIAGAAFGIGAAVASSFAGLAVRKWAIQRWGSPRQVLSKMRLSSRRQTSSPTLVR